MRKRLHIFTVLIWVLFSTTGHGQTLPRESAMVDFLLEYLAIRYPDHSFGTFLYVAAKKQKMYLIENGLISGEYTVSTAASGLGSERGSFRTPTGLHRIADKVGEGLPANSIIAQKMADGRKAEIVYTGLREGEKLHEELVGANEDLERPFHDQISHATVGSLSPENMDLQVWLDRMEHEKGAVIR